MYVTNLYLLGGKLVWILQQGLAALFIQPNKEKEATLYRRQD